MFQKSRLFNVISFCSSLEKVMHACSATETAIEMKGGALEILKRLQVIPRPGYPTT